jgi:hypothetical protein
MNQGNYKKLFIALLLTWFAVNMLQAVFTEILSDEAYYGLYGKYLAWGYFDHPPMIALFTKISSLFFKGNLGIRFMTVLVQTITLLITWKATDDNQPDRNKVFSFFIIAGSICLFSTYGFISTPDSPLLLFTALFLYSYKNFLNDQSWKNVFILSLSMAGLIYSKYQAALIIGFVVSSNFKLLKTYKFWISGIFALIILSPHIWWQVTNDYPSFKYHLIDRSDKFKWMYFLEYLPNQMVIFNPLILGAIVYVIIKNKAKELFTRALYFSIIGFIGFFWIMTFRGHVEPNWTIACSIPMIVLLYNKSAADPKMFKFVRKALLPSLLLIIVVRILITLNLPPVKSLALKGKREKFKFIESVAKDRPVLFLGSFPKPSLYSFFTGKEAMGINSVYSRKNQFDIWQFEKKYNNKPAFICGFGEGNSELYKKDGFEFYGYGTDSLQTINRIGVEIQPKYKVLNAGDTLSITLTLNNPYEYDIDFNHSKFPVSIYMEFLNGREINSFPVILHDPVSVIHSGEIITRTFVALVPDIPAGKYHFGVCLQNLFGPAINDSFSVIWIEKK